MRTNNVRTMIDMVTGEEVKLIESTYVDEVGLWTTIKYVQSRFGEKTPLWQYRHELRPAV